MAYIRRWTMAVVAISLSASQFVGCAFLHVYASANSKDLTAKCEALPPEIPAVIPPYVFQASCQSSAKTTRADGSINLETLPNGVFIGIAMSGGGSRAANFSAAVLLELEKLGLLQHVSAISSVSGSSLVAGYYGLFGDNSELWNEMNIRKVLRTDFEKKWLWSFVYPHNLLRLWLTDYDRTNLMSDVFDSVLFEGKTFGDMPVKRPVILINATQYNLLGVNWVFSDKTFKTLRSRLDTYPVSSAVMASAAFPGAFHNVTVSDFASDPKKTRYIHLYDAGPSDNLGIETLLEQADAYYKKSLHNKTGRELKGCFIFMVDSFPSGFFALQKGNEEPDTAKLIDRLIDTNALDASDLLLKKARKVGLEKLGLDPLGYRSAYKEFTLPNHTEGEDKLPPLTCMVWHIALQRINRIGEDFVEAMKFKRDDNKVYDDLDLRRDVYNVVNHIDTRFFLTNQWLSDSIVLQNALFMAAHYAVRENRAVLSKVCAWFESHGLRNLRCEEPLRIDYAPAVEWYQRRAEQGHADSQFMLGTLYEEGKAVPRDCQKAAQLYHQSGQSGHVGGLMSLASLYWNGNCSRDVPKDETKLESLFRQAAEYGYEDAQFKLGVVHALGIGVPPNYVQAYLWYSLASAKGNARAAFYLRGLKTLMLPEELQYADNLVRAWQPKPRLIEEPIIPIDCSVASSISIFSSTGLEEQIAAMSANCGFPQ